MYNSDPNPNANPNPDTITVHYHLDDGTTHELTASYEGHRQFLAGLADLADLGISNPVAPTHISLILDPAHEGHRQLLRQIQEAADQAHAAVLDDFYRTWHARFGSSTTSPATPRTTTDDDDGPEADERERGRGQVEVEDALAYLDQVVEGFEEREGDE